MPNVKVLFMGRKPVASMCLEYLLTVTNLEVVAVLTDSHLEVSHTSETARNAGIPIYDFDIALEKIRNGALNFDIGFSMLYWRKLRGDFLTKPSLGVINFHPAPLPEYKGTAGYNMAILDGREDWAVTAHYVDASIDTGQIIETEKFPINKDYETAKSLEGQCQTELFEQFKRVAHTAINSSELLPARENTGGRYISRTEMESMKEVKPGDDISRKIRAFWFPPYDGAFMMVNGVKCTLIDRSILESLSDNSSKPGAVHTTRHP